jgi:hypothetical protein
MSLLESTGSTPLVAEHYPTGPAQRDKWILQRRPPKVLLNPSQPYAFLWEEEVDPAKRLAPTSVVFLTNRECPFRCLMCDLWVAWDRDQVQSHRFVTLRDFTSQIKPYNAGSFDPQRYRDYPRTCSPRLRA